MSSCPGVFSACLSPHLLHFLPRHFLSIPVAFTGLSSALTFLRAISHYHCPQESSACLLYFKSSGSSLQFPGFLFSPARPSVTLLLLTPPYRFPNTPSQSPLCSPSSFLPISSTNSCFTTDRPALKISWKSQILSCFLAIPEPLSVLTPLARPHFLWALGAVWILTGTICLPQSWFLRAVQRKPMTLLVSNSVFIKSLSHALRDHLWKKESSR